VKKRQISFSLELFGFLILVLTWGVFIPQLAFAQAVPYARTFSRPKENVREALKELQAYAGQRLPIVEGFIGESDQPTGRYQRAFYQFSIDLLPAPSDATTVRVAAKITAWYADPDPVKSGYQVLPSNGRLESDLLDRLAEKLRERLPVSIFDADVQTPKANINYSTLLPRIAPSYSTSLPAPPAPLAASDAAGDGELAAIRGERAALEKRVQALNAELRSLQDLHTNQTRPRDLVIVKKAGAPLLAQPEQEARILFTAAEGDEFEFLDVAGEWVHVRISGASRGYIRRSSLELPEFIGTPQIVPDQTASTESRDTFHVVREEISIFPGGWEPLNGKPVKIYTVEPVSQSLSQTSTQSKLSFAWSLFRKFSTESAQDKLPVQGAVIIFDSADGGIIGTTILSVRQLATGSLSKNRFWTLCYLNPPDIFRPNTDRTRNVGK
jgi:hypothetical protein